MGRRSKASYYAIEIPRLNPERFSQSPQPPQPSLQQTPQFVAQDLVHTPVTVRESPLSRLGVPEFVDSPSAPVAELCSHDHIPGALPHSSSSPSRSFVAVSPAHSKVFKLPIRHESYYLEDGVVIEVENTLFKVPRYMLSQESLPLSKQLALCNHKSGPGSSDLNPIRFADLTAQDFFYILCLLYPKNVFGKPPVHESWGEREWEAVLKLATLWDMENIRAFAIKRISSCASSISKILLGREYSIHSWIREGFLELSLRKDRLSMNDAERLGLQQTLQVMSARERIHEEVELSRRPCSEVEKHTRYGWVSFKEVPDDDAETKASNAQNPGVHTILDEVFELED